MAKVKVVLKVSLHGDRCKKKAMVIVSGILRVESVSMDMKDSKLTIVGDIDPVEAVCKLRKLCHTEIVLVEQVQPPPQEQTKKPEEKKKEDEHRVNMCDRVKACHSYNHPPPVIHYNYYRSVDECPNGCVIS